MRAIFTTTKQRTARLTALRALWRQFGCERSRLMAISGSAEIDAIGGVGISVLCANPHSAAVVESLLDTRYPSTEIVVAINGDSQASLLQQLRATYSLVEVNTPAWPSTAPIRGLYRSRRRPFRRLVVVDVATDDRPSALDAAEAIASYDALVAILAEVTLHPSAIGRIAAEIACTESVVRFPSFASCDDELLVIARHQIQSEGGFAKYGSLANRPTLNRIAEILAVPMSENGGFMTDERPTYTFLNLLSLKIMKCKKKLLSLIKCKT